MARLRVFKIGAQEGYSRISGITFSGSYFEMSSEIPDYAVWTANMLMSHEMRKLDFCYVKTKTKS